MVNAETSTGKPARSDAMRATFMPCSALGHGAAQDDVFYFFRVDLRNAFKRALDGDRPASSSASGGAERALEGASDRRANR